MRKAEWWKIMNSFIPNHLYSIWFGINEPHKARQSTEGQYKDTHQLTGIWPFTPQMVTADQTLSWLS